MKRKKRNAGTKARIRAEKDRERRIVTLVFLASVMIGIISSAFLIYEFVNPPIDRLIEAIEQTPSRRRAALVDHLSLTFPNDSFVNATRRNLEKAGYMFDYFSGEHANVEFYRNLATHGYKIILLRVHSSATMLQGKKFVETPVFLFTSEVYSREKYIWEQITHQLCMSCYSVSDVQLYFGITPDFVRFSMKGKFDGATVIMMGCEGLNNTGMAEVFLEKGAKVYIGWKGYVSVSDTDTVAEHLLMHLLGEIQTIGQAVRETMEEVALDPTLNSELAYYPTEAAEQTAES